MIYTVPVILIIASMTSVAPTLTPIYRCTSDAPGQEVPYFTDIGCIDGHRVTPRRGSIVSGAPLTPAERKTLAGLKDSGKRERRTSKTQKDECLAAKLHAKEQLRVLRQQRRKGYNVKQANELEAREQSLKRARRQTC